MSYYAGGNAPGMVWIDSKLRNFKDPFSDGISRKYWDAQYYLEKPKSKEQLDDQMKVGAWFPPLTQYHQNKEAEKKLQYTMDLYGIDFDQVKYPYLTALGQGSYGASSLVRGAVSVSKNLFKLYL